MSNAQNSHGQSLTVPFYPMEKSTITESSRQVPVVLQPSTTSIQIFESFEHVRIKIAAVKCIHPKIGCVLDLNNQPQMPPV